MRKKEDEFKKGTRDLLAGRVGWKCSNPLCRKLTCGPGKGKDKVVNVGEASHICAASPGGKRYEVTMDSEERSSYENGIWFCRTCAKMIDSDIEKYSVEALREWKWIAEEYAESEIRILSPSKTTEKDIKILTFIKSCFDRPAFMDDIMCEGSMENLDKAFEDTVIAINTGILLNRSGKIIKKSEGKSVIQNPQWQEQLEVIAVLIDAMRRKIQIAKKEGKYHENSGFVIFKDFQLAEWLNLTRIQVIETFSALCVDAGIGSIRFRARKYN